MAIARNRDVVSAESRETPGDPDDAYQFNTEFV